MMAANTPGGGLGTVSSVTGTEKNEMIKALLFSAVSLREDAIRADLNFVAYLADMAVLELQSEVQRRGLSTPELQKTVRELTSNRADTDPQSSGR